jgi:hypothetical protein
MVAAHAMLTTERVQMMELFFHFTDVCLHRNYAFANTAYDSAWLRKVWPLHIRSIINSVIDGGGRWWPRV